MVDAEQTTWVALPDLHGIGSPLGQRNQIEPEILTGGRGFQRVIIGADQSRTSQCDSKTTVQKRVRILSSEWLQMFMPEQGRMHAAGIEMAPHDMIGFRRDDLVRLAPEFQGRLKNSGMLLKCFGVHYQMIGINPDAEGVSMNRLYDRV